MACARWRARRVSSFALLNMLVLDNGRRWGEIATDWQRADARAVLEPGEGDPNLHWIGRPKGGSKTTDVAGLSIGWLVELAAPLATGYVAASDRDQANRLLAQAGGLIARTEMDGFRLSSILKVEAMRIVNVKTRASVEALAADAPGSEGLLSPFIVLDELPNWADVPSARKMLNSLMSAWPKVPGCRFLVIGHAGSPSHFSFKTLEHARTSGMWRVNEVPGPLPWVPSEVLEEQRKLLMPSEFERRVLNEWTEPEDLLANLDDLRACVSLQGPSLPTHGVRYVMGLDLGIKNDATVAAVCHVESVDRGYAEGRQLPFSSRVVLDRMMRWKPSRLRPVNLTEVEDWCAEAVRSYGCPIVFDVYQAVHLTQRLRARGATCTEFAFTQPSIGRLAALLHSLIRDRALALPDDEGLLDELAHVRLRETSTPGIMRMDHDPSRHDDRAIALALAAYELVGAKPVGVLRVSSYLDNRLAGRGRNPRVSPEMVAMAERLRDPRPASERAINAPSQPVMIRPVRRSTR